MNNIKHLAALTLAALASLPAQALDITGTTVGAPLWNRPLAGTPPTGLSGVATAVPYTALTFTVSAAGSYSFLSTATNPANWDNYSFLYLGSFIAAAPLLNALVGNDDFNSTTGLSGFSATLNTGTSYVFVTTGFSNSSAGAYLTSINGPGSINVVPEPGTYGLMGAGALAVLLAARRRAGGVAGAVAG